ncbi:hypothetical protein BH18CHL2_BH18CHL2_00270 [soil metagenome]
MHPGMRGKPVLHRGDRVSRAVVEHQMQLTTRIPPRDPAHEVQEVRTGVTVCHLAGTRPLATSSAAYRLVIPARRQSWVCRAGRPGRSGSIGWVRSRAWIWVFSSASGSVVNLKVRLRCGWSACARQIRCTVLADRPVARQLTDRPVGKPRRRRLEGERDDPGALAPADRWRPARARTVGQPRRPLSQEAAADAADLDGCVSGPLRDLDPAEAPVHQEHRAGPAAKARRTRRGALQLLERGAIGVAEHHGTDGCGHRSPSSLNMEGILS